MEEKKEIKISLRFAIVSILVIIAFIFSLIVLFTTKGNELKKENVNSDSTYYIDTYQGQNYYIINKDYSNEYDIQFKSLYNNANANNFEVNKCMTYDEYKSFCKLWNLNQKYTDKTMNYIMFSYISHGSPNLEVRLADVEISNLTAKLFIWDDSSGVTADVMAYIIIIPTSEKINNIEVQPLYTKAEFNSISHKYDVTGYTYTTADNKKLAEKCYISSNNTNLNSIVNNMLDSIVKEHTIKLECDYEDDYSIEYFDLINSASKITDKDNNVWMYGTYTEMETIKYMDVNQTNSFEKTTSNETREYMLTHIYDLEPLLNTSKFSYKINEDEKNYIIEAKNSEILGIYYINKSNYLLNKIDITNYGTYSSWNTNITISYTKDTVNVPSNIISSSQEHISIDKPIIYLYPEKEIEISVKLGKPDNITCSYPKYKNGWNVIAKPDGTLIDTDTGRSLYALYWEGISARKAEIKEGFVVKGEDTIKFLEEKLEILGLNEREAEEFIVYWLPKLEANKYNYIRFATIDEINKDMPLEFSVKPDTLIRVLMEFKGLDEYIEVSEQKLETPERNGFVVVEWGGTELK